MIERFYNPVRKHSKPSFLSLGDFEQGLTGEANRPGNWGKPRLTFMFVVRFVTDYIVCGQTLLSALSWERWPAQTVTGP